MGNLCVNPAGSTKGSINGQLSIAVYHERYKQDRKQLGEGRAGHVYKCTERSTSKIFACKNISKSTQSLIECRREVMILNKIKGSKSIIFLKDVFEDNRSLYLVTELCEGGELYDQIVDRSQTDYGRFSESETATMMKQIIGAVQACHDKHQVTHRDLKPENFLLKRKNDLTELRMIDFGLSRFYTPDERLRTRVGTVYYTAPEVWNENYDQSCDLWSCGVIMYVLLCSYPPFDGDTDKEILRAVCRGKYAFPSPEWDDVSAEAKTFIRKLLSKNPRRRPTASESLKDEWFTIAQDDDEAQEIYDDDVVDAEEEEDLDLAGDDDDDEYTTTNSATVQLTDSDIGNYSTSRNSRDMATYDTLKGIQKGGSSSSTIHSPPKPPGNDDAAGYAQMIRNINEEKKKQRKDQTNTSNQNGSFNDRNGQQEEVVKKRGNRRRETSDSHLGGSHSNQPRQPATPETSPDKNNNDDDDWGISSGVASVGSAMGLY